MNNQKNGQWRVIAAVVSAVYIVYMWSEKDILAVYGSMPLEQALPMIVTTVAVSLFKLGALAAGILLLKWIMAKFKK